MLSTYADLKESGISKRINLCPDDPRLMTAVNRLIQWLLAHGSFWGTVRRAQFCLDRECITMPGCVASLEAVFQCCHAGSVKGMWYQMIPGRVPASSCGEEMIYEAFGTIPTAYTMCYPGKLRVFCSSPADVGKTIRFMGHDVNRAWVRMPNDGVIQDGEVITLKQPWADSETIYRDITAVQKQETVERVYVYYTSPGTPNMELLSQYEYWETRPDYQRFRIPHYRGLPSVTCTDGTAGISCTRQVIEALVKLEYQPIRRDTDYLLIGNLAALELGLEALKAKDDGDLAKADILLFGNIRNQRLGAIPLLQQELRTMTGDRFEGRVRLDNQQSMHRAMVGFI